MAERFTRTDLTTVDLEEGSGVFASVSSCFRLGEVHVVAVSDASQVLEPVTFGAYHKKGDPEYESGESQWVLCLKNGLWPEYGNAGDLLAPLLYRQTIIIPVPSSTKGKISGMNKVASFMAESKGMVDGSKCLVRHTTVDKQHTTAGLRTRKKHLDSITCEVPEGYRERRILLIDDIFTSGTSMSASLEMLMEEGCENVTCATFARTL